MSLRHLKEGLKQACTAFLMGCLIGGPSALLVFLQGR